MISSNGFLAFLSEVKESLEDCPAHEAWACYLIIIGLFSLTTYSILRTFTPNLLPSWQVFQQYVESAYNTNASTDAPTMPGEFPKDQNTEHMTATQPEQAQANAALIEVNSRLQRDLSAAREECKKLRDLNDFHKYLEEQQEHSTKEKIKAAIEEASIKRKNRRNIDKHELVQLRSSLENCQNEVTTLRKQLETANTKLKARNSANIKESTRAAELESQLQQSRSELQAQLNKQSEAVKAERDKGALNRSYIMKKQRRHLKTVRAELRKVKQTSQTDHEAQLRQCQQHFNAEYAKVVAQRDELRFTLTQATEQSQRDQKEQEDLHAIINTHGEEVRSLKEQNGQLKQQVAEQADRNDLQDTINSQGNQINLLREENNDLKQHIAKQDDRKDLHAAIDTQAREMDSLKDKNNALKQLIARQNDRPDLQAVIKQHANEITSLKHENSNLRQRITEQDDRATRLYTAQNEAANAVTAARDMEQERDNMAAARDRAQAQVQAQDVFYQNTMSQNRSMQYKIRQLEHDLGATTEDLNNARDANTQLQAQINDQPQANSANQMADDQEVEQLKAQNQKLSNEVSNLQSLQSKPLSTLETEKQRLAQELQQERIQRAKAQTQINDLSKRLAEAKKSTATTGPNTPSQTNDLQRQLNNLKSTMITPQAAQAKLSNQEKRLREAHQRATAQQAFQLNRRSAEVTSLTAEVADLKTIVDDLKAQMALGERQREGVQQTLQVTQSHLKHDKERLQAQVDQLTGVVPRAPMVKRDEDEVDAPESRCAKHRRTESE